MNCPICSVTLQIAERQGVEIDFCPQCRGVWLDRGELDKILERSVQEMPARSYQAPVQAPPVDNRYERPYDKHQDKHHDSHHGEYRPHKKKGFLHDLFD